MGKLSYKGRADSAKRLRQASGLEDDAMNFLLQNYASIMDSDLPEDEKEFLSELVEIKGGDLTGEIEDYIAAYNGGSDERMGW